MYVSPSSFVCSVLLVLPLILPLARILHLRIILLERSSQHATSQSRLVMENPANRPQLVVVFTLILATVDSMRMQPIIALAAYHLVLIVFPSQSHQQWLNDSHHEALALDVELIFSGCCSPPRCGHPRAAYQQKSAFAGLEGFLLCLVPLKKENGQTVMVPLFQSQENIAGKISVEPVSGKKVEHNGIKVELLGQIEMYFDRGNFYDFTSLVRELDVPGEIYERKTYPFEFSTVEMPYETYNGVNVRLR
ncbi:hypothetical protein MTR67_019174 [Solanum verrucosum]|uniref:Uncharacterized protein n=1 Tax=Solanum verrucosum TaxID=315347 RepID=A0AAF0QTT0_SOLVR|nr:hypothetical protein MTR67_019174 [Solanum verrucosum]